MKYIYLRVFFAFFFFFHQTQAQIGGWDPKAEEKARETIQAFQEKDAELKEFFSQAYGYVVFPSVGKAAIGLGGAHGKGTLFQSGRVIGSAKMTQVTIGFQLGGQSYAEVIFFEDAASLDDFKSGDLEFAAQASAVAADIGASADVAYQNGVAVFTMANGGLMYEASIGGQKFKYIPNKKIAD
ncbi:MAG: lipid-binding SYLF domain-containing protein [Bacteroidetes bacterium]|nr:lipid-binding SYLF domain-containing protein [Bacteroidota bacterium]